MALSWRSLLRFRSTTRPLIIFTFCLTVIHSLGEDVDNLECLPAPNISCRLSNGTQFKFSGEEVGFNKSIPCRNVSGYSYKVAVALSLFLGWIGADRFYLGYPALGHTFSPDVLRIVGPSDGSDYIVDYYGARLTRLSITNETYRRTQHSP
ncbi:TM2 domain-containing 1 isoform X2 [Labeo rohita]|uniref:TM2 domain-containing 1 isoform X2 n=1 Tax=Labeo rohita TaxID=84645 RepID=A0A498MP81_LABRO|nr:TM2 domain-containing 1 isoform X2 [Labeo rohita]